MWPDRVLNPGPLTHESGAVPTVLRGPACKLLPLTVDSISEGFFEQESKQEVTKILSLYKK